MGLKWTTLFLCGCLLPAAPLPDGPAEPPTPRYEWNLADLYPDLAAWSRAKEALASRLAPFIRHRGHLSKSAGQLRRCLEEQATLNQEYARLFTYISLKGDLDLRDQTHLAARQELDQLGTRLGEAFAFVDPEILAIPPARLQAFLKADKGLKDHRFALEELARQRPHVGDQAHQRLMASAERITGTPRAVYDLLIGADLPHPTLTLKDGRTLALDEAAYDRQLHSRVPEDRAGAMAAHFGQLHAFRATFGALLNAEVNKNIFNREARGYPTCLAAALDQDDIPVQVYRNLIEQVNRNLGTLHRYLGLRRRVLGLEQLHYHDLALSLGRGPETRYSLADAEDHLQAALAPLGETYQALLKRAFAEHWIDALPRPGKASGGYSNAWAYAAHPFVLANFNGRYDGGLDTLAHELGHALQGHLSNAHQPFVLAAMPRFLAEIPSTFNEQLLSAAMLRRAKADADRLELLGNGLEGIRVTVFKATLLAEFEAQIHERAEKGEALTGDSLNRIYLGLVRRYYGHDQGICLVDEAVQSEWSAIPQLFHAFYAYQYATSYTAATALCEQVLRGDPAAAKRYLDFLGAGGSAPAMELLRRAGVDLASTAPFDLLMDRMNRMMNELEALLGSGISSSS